MTSRCLAYFLLLLALGSATGCANLTGTRQSSATAESFPPGAPQPAVPPQESPSLRPELPPRGRNPAVVALLGSADEKAVSGRLDEAAAALERAVRIDPRDAEIWVRLADVRLRQQQYRQAETLALKASGLTEPHERGLRARSFRIVAQARRSLGDFAGAREAEEQAQAFLQ